MGRELISHEDGSIYEFTPDLEGVTTVESGAQLTIETRDSLDGAVQSESDLLESVPEEVNAATGPIAVEGASPGDVLRVEIEVIRLAEDRGRVITVEGFGLLDGREVIEDPAVDLERPLVETPDAWKPIASAETLEAACELANEDAIELLAAEHGVDRTDAYLLSSLVGIAGTLRVPAARRT